VSYEILHHMYISPTTSTQTDGVMNHGHFLRLPLLLWGMYI